MTSFDERIKQTDLENSSLFDNLPHLLPITDNFGTKYHYSPSDSGRKKCRPSASKTVRGTFRRARGIDVRPASQTRAISRG